MLSAQCNDICFGQLYFHYTRSVMQWLQLQIDFDSIAIDRRSTPIRLQFHRATTIQRPTL